MKIKEKGITLISLAVTIIVMIILAAVAINLSVGDKGLISQTQNAIGGYENASTQEQNSMNDFISNINEALNGDGTGGSEGGSENISEKPQIELTGWNTIGGLVEISTIESYTTEYKIGNGTWQEYLNTRIEVENGSTIYARYKDNKGNTSPAVSKIIKDTNPPRLTGNINNTTSTTATVIVSATDDEMGMPNPILYKIRKRK